MAEYTQEDLAKLPQIDKATGKNLEPGVISAEEAKRLSLGAPPDPNQEQQDQPDPPAATDPPLTPAEPSQEEAPASIEDKVIKVGGIEKKRSEWLEEFATEAKIDVSALPGETQDTLLNHFIDSKHKAAWQQNLTQKSEEVAAKRKEVEATQRQLDQQKHDQAEKRRRLEAEQKKLKETASRAISKEDLYDAPDRIDPDKQFEYNQMKEAQAKLPEIEAALAQLEQEVVQTDTGRLLASMEIVQATHPELNTSKPIETVVDEIEKQKIQNHPDRQKYLDLLEVSDYSQAYGLPMEQAAERLIQQGRLLSVRESTQTTESKLSNRNTTQEKLVEQIARNQKATPAKLPQGGSPPRVQIQPKADLAQNMRKASSIASGGGTGDELRKSGY